MLRRGLLATAVIWWMPATGWWVRFWVRVVWFMGLDYPHSLVLATAQDGLQSCGSRIPSLVVNLDVVRSFFAIADLGSLSKAAERLRVSQSTLTRQMQSLEHDIGGLLFERGPSGVALTAAGHVLREGMAPVLESFDRVVASARRRARGQSADLKIGYIASAAAEYLNPALSLLRARHPEIKVRLFDLSPGEQIAGLRKGDVDIALLGHPGAFLSKEFYVRKIASVPVFVVLSESHARAGDEGIRLEDLKNDVFVGAGEGDLPGHNRWVTTLCRKAGFRPRFVADADSLTHGLSTVIAENGVSLLPIYASKTGVPGVVFKPLIAPSAVWELLVAWQRGRVSTAVQALLESLPKRPSG